MGEGEESSSSSRMHTERIVWPGHADSSVICTGEFDNWQGTQLLQRGRDGTWYADVKVPYAEGEKDIKYKFVVDGTWQHAESRPQVHDDSGNVNNVFHVPAEPVAPTPAPASSVESTCESGQTEAASKSAQGESETIDEVIGRPGSPPGKAQPGIPASTLQDLLRSSSDSDPSSQIKIFDPSSLQSARMAGNGSSSGSEQQQQQPNYNDLGNHFGGFQTFSMSSFANTDFLNERAKQYPSPYLLQVPAPTEPVTPTDVQIAAEYLTIRHDAAREASRANAEQGGPSSSSTQPQPQAQQQQTEPLGILKIFAKIRERNPQWIVSEKRLRKVVKEPAAMAEADRIARLADKTGMGIGKFGDEVVPVSRIDQRLVADLEGRAYIPPSSSSSATAPATAAGAGAGAGAETMKQPQLVNGAGLSSSDSENKENAIPSGSGGSSGNGKKKSKKASSSSSDRQGVNGVLADAADKVAQTVSSILPTGTASSTSTAAASSTAGNDGKAVPKGPTAITGDVRVQWMDDVKGRGVISSKAVKKGSVIFKEDAFVFAPTRTIQQAVNEGQGCGFCGKLFLGKSALAIVVPCTAHDAIPVASSSPVSSSSLTAGRKVLGPASGAAGNKKRVASSATIKKTPSADKEKEKALVRAGDNGESLDGVAGEEKKEAGCKLKFCSKLCRDRCTEQYANLMCPIVNPSYAALLKWSETQDPRNGRQNPLGIFKLYLRLIVAAQKDGFPPSSSSSHASEAGKESSRDLLERIESLAAINERTRKNKEMGMFADMQWGEDWMTGHRLILEALQLPAKYCDPNPISDPISTDDEAESAYKDASSTPPLHPGKTLQPAPAGALPSWYTKDLPHELADKILGFNNLLVWWGRVALNQEDDGGIFILHPCLNHSCDPNAIVKRTPSLNNIGAREARPSRIYVVALKDISEGEEITIAYYQPAAPIENRREYLKKAYLFDCFCSTCESQAAEKGIPLRYPAVAASKADPLPASSSTNGVANDDDGGAPFAAAAGASSSTSTAKKNKKKKSKAALNGSAAPTATESRAIKEDEDEKDLTLEQKAERMFAKKDGPEASAPWYED